VTVAVFTRDAGARDALALALSRLGVPFVIHRTADALAEAAGTMQVLIFGPDVSEAEARQLRSLLSTAEPPALLLLQDLGPKRHTVRLPVHGELPLPLALTPLRQALRLAGVVERPGG